MSPRLTYRMPEVAEALGVGLSSVQRWVASGDLEHIRPPGGGVVLITPKQLDAFLERHREGKAVKRLRATG